MIAGCKFGKIHGQRYSYFIVGDVVSGFVFDPP